MDIYHHFNLRRIQPWISRRIPKIQAPSFIRSRDTGFFKQHYKRILSGIFLLTSIGLGIKAHEASQEEGIQTWEKNHLPSQATVQYALGSKGFYLLKELKIIQKVMRTLPTSLDEAGSFWESPDHQWVVYYTNTHEELKPTIYCTNCTKPPNNWQPRGIGWKAFDQLVSEPTQKQEKPKSPKQKPKPKDPREIVY